MLELKQLRRLHLHPTDLRIDAGECVAVQGTSGCGKSLLLRAVADLDPHEGDAAIEGQWCSRMPAAQWRRQVRYVPAESGWWHDDVRSHFPADADLAPAMARLGLGPELAAAPVARLSTGERQRLALLRALSPGVRALLLDEPTSGLDEDSTARVEDWLHETMTGGISVLLVTHSDAQARRLARRRLLLRDGRLQEALA